MSEAKLKSSGCSEQSRLYAKLAARGAFKGFEGLEGLANSQEFWDKQPYGTRLYYGDGGADYLHRSILKTAIEILKENREMRTLLEYYATVPQDGGRKAKEFLNTNKNQ